MVVNVVIWIAFHFKCFWERFILNVRRRSVHLTSFFLIFRKDQAYIEETGLCMVCFVIFYSCLKKIIIMKKIVTTEIHQVTPSLNQGQFNFAFHFSRLCTKSVDKQ